MKNFTWIFLALALNSYGQTPSGGVTDIDGNTYSTVIIETQEWQKENLNVSKYSDGTLIPQVTDQNAWENLTTGAWCFYNNDPANGTIYGKLYNWYAVAGIHDNDQNTPNKILAPEGWHIPTDTEWSTLINHLDSNADGGYNNNIAGGKMKAISISLWQSPNAGANNSSGFTGLPGGYRENTFASIATYGNWWDSLEDDFNTRNAKTRSLGHLNSGAYIYSYSKSIGCSVRCLKNNPLSNTIFGANSFNIYPNPAKEKITIDCGNKSNIIGGNFKILNMLGQEVLNGVLSSQQSVVDLNVVKSQGIYFVKIYDSLNNLMDTKKIILQ